MNRLYRNEAAKFIGCSTSTLTRLEKTGLMDGTFYTFGNRKIYITEELERWIKNGGELGAYERKNSITLRRCTHNASA